MQEACTERVSTDFIVALETSYGGRFVFFVLRSMFRQKGNAGVYSIVPEMQNATEACLMMLQHTRTIKRSHKFRSV